MGYIEYKRGKPDVNGNAIWYYRFFTNQSSDYTEHFGFVGRKTTLNKIRVIRSHISPEDLFNLFNTIQFKFYVLPELRQAQKAIDICNNHSGCAKYCSNDRVAHCEKVEKHSRYVTLNNTIDGILKTPKERFIEKK